MGFPAKRSPRSFAKSNTRRLCYNAKVRTTLVSTTSCPNIPPRTKNRSPIVGFLPFSFSPHYHKPTPPRLLRYYVPHLNIQKSKLLLLLFLYHITGILNKNLSVFFLSIHPPCLASHPSLLSRYNSRNMGDPSPFARCLTASSARQAMSSLST